jgi:phage-related protein
MLLSTEKYQIQYFNEAVQKDILALPLRLAVRYVALTERMTRNGPNLGEPHTKALEFGLFELRLKGAEGIARVFYCTIIERQIVMLHAIVKKTDKIPHRELRLARNRMKELKNAHS